MPGHVAGQVLAHHGQPGDAELRLVRHGGSPRLLGRISASGSAHRTTNAVAILPEIGCSPQPLRRTSPADVGDAAGARRGGYPPWWTASTLWPSRSRRKTP